MSRDPALDKGGPADGGPESGGPPLPAGAGHTPIGQQLRRARMAAGISLREMARRVDVSASFISQVELGRTMPSVGTLYSIASELGVSLDGLMPTPQSQTSPPASEPPATIVLRELRTPPKPFSPAGAEAPVQRASNRHELKIAGAVWGRLTAGHDPANDFLHVTYQPGAESCPEDQMIHHRGFEYGYIITGRLEVQVGFDVYEIGPGDSISFDSMTPHRLSNPYVEVSQSIWVVVGRGGTPVL